VVLKKKNFIFSLKEIGEERREENDEDDEEQHDGEGEGE
jgi:hypothetical protein